MQLFLKYLLSVCGISLTWQHVWNDVWVGCVKVWIYVGKSNLAVEERLFLFFSYTRTDCMGIIVFPI